MANFELEKSKLGLAPESLTTKKALALEAEAEERLLLDAKSVAAMLSVSVSTVYKLVKQDRLPPPVHITPYISRWRVQDLRELVQSLK